jgi:hypothetical protein
VPVHDHGRDGPRALRADRFATVRLGGRGVAPPDDFDAIAFVSRTLARVPWSYVVEVLLHASPDRAAERFPPTLAELEAEGEGTRLRMRAESLLGRRPAGGRRLRLRDPPPRGAA